MQIEWIKKTLCLLLQAYDNRIPREARLDVSCDKHTSQYNWESRIPHQSTSMDTLVTTATCLRGNSFRILTNAQNQHNLCHRYSRRVNTLDLLYRGIVDM
mgnify:CR=1 FL=1